MWQQLDHLTVYYIHVYMYLTLAPKCCFVISSILSVRGQRKESK